MDYTRPFAASDHAAWQEEYLAAVQPAAPILPARPVRLDLLAGELRRDIWDDEDWFAGWDRRLAGRGSIGLSGFKEPAMSSDHRPF